MEKIPFNVPPVTGNEERFVLEAIRSHKLCGDGVFTKKCQQWFEEAYSISKTLFTPSCTHALEMAALLLDLRPGDEVIMPSYTFVSTANAFALRGVQVKFVDVRPDTMNLDERKIEEAISDKTKAIVPVHYAGVACEMGYIMALAEKYDLYVIEDAAQAMHATYKGKQLGTFGNLGAFSFHETKNYTSGGEGGLLLINDANFEKRAEILREKGTNRSEFFRGSVDKYTWVDLGSSYLPSELQAAYLFGQLSSVNEINDHRLTIWYEYVNALSHLRDSGYIELPVVPEHCGHNAHMFYIKVKDISERTGLMEYLKSKGVFSVFHYVPLHSSDFGIKISEFVGVDEFTTSESERLLRLPLWYGMDVASVKRVADSISEYFRRV